MADADRQSAQLVSQASQGDPAAIDSLLERHLPRLRAFIRLKAGEQIRAKESVADLVQSVCREVLQDLDQFRYEGEAAFRQWLFNAAMRKIVDRGRFYKAQKRDAAREVRLDAGSGTDDAGAAEIGALFTPSRDAMVQEEAERIAAAFRALPDHYREVVTMARIYGYSNAEIGAEIGKGEGAVRMLLSRALTRLSALLRDPERGR